MPLPRAAARRLAAGHLLPLLALVVLPLLLFRDAVFGGGALYERDIYLYWHAQVEAIVRSVAAGAWPLWDPLASFGEPLWEVPAPSSVVYPTTWLNLLLPAWSFYTWNAVLHCSFGGIGLYLLAHRLGCSRLAALAGATLWVVSGPQLSVVNMLNLLNGAAWMPWTLLAVEAALRTGEDLPALGWGACLAAQVVAGSETGLMVGLLGAVWTLAAFLTARGSGRFRVIRVASVALLFAVTLSAATWLPFLSLTRRTARGALPEEVRTHWSVRPAELLQTVMPIFPRQLPLRVDAHPELEELAAPYLYSLYMGIPALALAAAGLAARRRRAALGLLAVAVVAAVFALGRHSWLYDVVITALPPLQAVRFPVKAMLLFSLAAALLAALGVDAWRRGGRAALGAAASVGLALGLLAAVLARLATTPPGWVAGLLAEDPSSPGPLAALAGPLALAAAEGGVVAALAVASLRRALAPRVALVVAGLATLGAAWNQRALNPTAPPELFRYRPATYDAIRDDGGTRVYFRSVTGRVPITAPTASDDRIAPGVGVALTTKLYLTPPAARILGIASSYVGDVKGVHPPSLVALYDRLRETAGTPAHLRLLQLGAVSHTVYLDRFGTEDLEPLASVRTLYGNQVLLFRVPGALPRCYVVGGVRVADGEEALDVLVDPGFDPTREVVLAGGEERSAPASLPGRARLVDLAADRVSIEARLEAPGYLVLVDGYDAHWRATVDGRAVPLLRANVAFRALSLDRGEHRIEMRYRPPSVLVGTWISGIAALAGAGRFALRRRRA